MAELNGVRPVNQRNVTISESFFKNLMRLASENIIPYQWEALNDNVPGAEPSYCIRNLRAAAGRIKEPHGGCVFQDSDLFKWIEAAAYMLMWKEDPEIERHIDETVQLMEEAQSRTAIWIPITYSPVLTSAGRTCATTMSCTARDT